jgi:regulator of protease activity HflC (stomatin/prohibitin superfamily)
VQLLEVYPDLIPDNVTLSIDGVLYYKVFDAYKASYGIDNAEYAITQLAQTTMVKLILIS